MTLPICQDPVILNQWHPICALDNTLQRNSIQNTTLLGEELAYVVQTDGEAKIWRICDQNDDGAVEYSLPIILQYDYLWTCLGHPPDKIFPFPEFEEPDRRKVATGAFYVNVSPGRAVENFLDMGHFPYIHTGILGEEPHTEVKEYDVEVSESRDEIRATRCRFFQPKAALASDEGADVEYIYRVPHINCAVLYKSSPIDPQRLDSIFLFIQPIGEEFILAHTGMCILDEDNSDSTIRLFQQTIFGQDKPILENQYPKRLPLDPRAETPIRADKSAIAYRRWLSQKGLQYGVIATAS